MAYVPVDDSDLVGTVLGDSAAWPLLIANDAVCYANYQPTMTAFTSPTATALARQFRWRAYGNLDNSDLNVGIRAVGVTGPHTVTMATVGVDSDTVSVGADGYYYTVLQARGPMQEIIVSSAALGGGTLAYKSVMHQAGPPVPSGGTRYPSGYRLIGDLWADPDMPVSTEVMARLARNPRYIARDRPVCVVAHVADTVKAVSAKSPDVWGAYNTTNWEGVGRLHVPVCDRVERLFRVDAYVNETTPGTASFSVKVGSREERWQGVGWHSWQVRLGPTAHEIRATVQPGTSNGAAIRTLTVWRTEL